MTCQHAILKKRIKIPNLHPHLFIFTYGICTDNSILQTLFVYVWQKHFEKNINHTPKHANNHHSDHSNNNDVCEKNHPVCDKEFTLLVVIDSNHVIANIIIIENLHSC